MPFSGEDASLPRDSYATPFKSSRMHILEIIFAAVHELTISSGSRSRMTRLAVTPWQHGRVFGLTDYERDIDSFISKTAPGKQQEESYWFESRRRYLEVTRLMNNEHDRSFLGPF